MGHLNLTKPDCYLIPGFPFHYQIRWHEKQ